jgi:hypothetical protein
VSTVITPPLPSVPTTDQTTKADQADPPEVTLMQLTAIEDAEALGLPIPCRAFDPEVFFAGESSPRWTVPFVTPYASPPPRRTPPAASPSRPRTTSRTTT